MYTREILSTQRSPVDKGVPIQGTWVSGFGKVDLTEIAKPYFIKLPKGLINFRIKEWQSFSVQDNDFFLTAFIANMKFFSFVELFFFDRNSKEKICEFKVFPFSAWKPTTNLNNAVIDVKTSGLSFRVHNWLDSKSVRFDFDISSSFHTQAFTAQLEFDFDVRRSTPLCVNLLSAPNRCQYSYKSLSAVRGRIVWGARRIVLHRNSSTGLFFDNKGFYPYRSKINYCSAFGIDEQNKNIGFSFCDKPTREQNKNNENALWINGDISTLPPVRITQTVDEGRTEWIIQDLEGMVDLSFTPLESFENKLSVFFSRFEHKLPIGYFTGVLIDKTGNPLKLHNFFGISENISFRI